MRILLLLLLSGWSAGLYAQEAWKQVFMDETLVVSVDVASFSRQKQNVIFRERHVLSPPQTDPDSLRKIVEIQYRRMANCVDRKLAVLSRAAFSENNALLQYEAFRVGKAKWIVPRSVLENSLLISVCGAV